MVTVDDYGAIRRARRDGMTIRQIARQFGHSRKTVRHALTHAEPHPEPLTRNRPAPKLGPFQAIIDQILIDDEAAPPKQRHTAAQVFRRVRDEHGYRGVYVQVQRYVRKHRPRHQETFIPLGHLPGQRLEADFGHIHVDFPDGRRLVPFLVTAWAYSNAPFVLALPFERTEAILEGHGRGVRVLRGRAQGSLVGQPQDRRHVDPPGSRTPVPCELRGAGQPLRLRAALLHAGPRQREARRRGDRQGGAEAVRHARAPRRRPRRVERVLPQALRGRA